MKGDTSSALILEMFEHIIKLNGFKLDQLVLRFCSDGTLMNSIGATYVDQLLEHLAWINCWSQFRGFNLGAIHVGKSLEQSLETCLEQSSE